MTELAGYALNQKNYIRVETGSKSIKFYSLGTIFIHSYGQSHGTSHAEELKNKQTKDPYDGPRFVYDNLICIIMASIHVYSVYSHSSTG